MNSNVIKCLSRLIILTGFGLLPMSFTQAQEAKSHSKAWAEIMGVDENSCTYKMAMDLGLSPYTFLNLQSRTSAYSLENTHCSRMSLGSFESAFAEGKDLPAAELNTQLSSQENNLESIYAFNQESHQLWEELISCHGNAEKARQAYLKLDSKCGLNLKIKNLSQSVLIYLKTTLPKVKNENTPVIMHPLLTQIVLENALASSFIAFLDYKKDDATHYIRGAMTEFINDGYSLEDFDGPNAAIVKRKHNSLHFFYKERLYELHNWMAYQYRQMNAVNLLKSNMATDCASLGLWPGISRVVSIFIDNDYNNRSLGKGEISKIYLNACGDMRFTPSAYGGESRASLNIIKDFRKLSNRFSN